MNTVLTKTYEAPPFDVQEILRYSGCKDAEDGIVTLVSECISECKDVFSYRVCYTECAVEVDEERVTFPFMEVKSKALAKNLCGCETAVIFAATVGIGIDRLITKYSKISPAKAVIFQAIGAERIESLCNMFNDELKMNTQGLFAVPRFSPGYGDFNIESQRDIFRVLDCPKLIGLSLNESLLMSPSKSVTAVIGIGKNAAECASECSACDKKNCEFRRESK